MFCSVKSAAAAGIESCMIDVEADVSDGLPVFEMVGFLGSEVKEARERVRSAIRNAGFKMMPKRIVVNLSPADIRKAGASFDLPIAMAVMGAFGYMPVSGRLRDTLILGELSLNGRVCRVNGVLSAVLMAQEAGCRCCIIPRENLAEGAVAKRMQVRGVETLAEVVAYIRGEDSAGTICTERLVQNEDVCSLPYQEDDFADIHGQYKLKRGMEVAAAGMHNMLMVGPPGSGKSMAARCFSSIMPDMSYEEKLELSRIYSMAGMMPAGRGLVDRRPFRHPHHSVSQAALIGGGRIPRPGEITLAHHGVLFLDELAEFSRSTLDALREPMENRSITINRLRAAFDYPADCLIIAATNACPCGYYPDAERCTCSEAQIRRYMGHISQAFLDRMDMLVEVMPVSFEELYSSTVEESSEQIRKRVWHAHDIQRHRYAHMGIQFNEQIPSADIEDIIHLDNDDRAFMESVYRRQHLSTRSYYRILKVARTIADLGGKERVGKAELKEALFYKGKRGNSWGCIDDR